MRIAFVTTCRGRLEHLKLTLPQNIQDNTTNNVVFVLLDYNDQDGVEEYVRIAHAADFDAGTLVYYKTRTPTRFHMTHAKNMAHRCALLEGADICVTLDADNYTGPGFANYIHTSFKLNPRLAYMAPDFRALPPPGRREHDPENPRNLARGFAGRLVITSQAFLKVGGYNEKFDMWGSEDIDILARLDRLKFEKQAIHPCFLNAIGHGPGLRFKEYPEARAMYENDAIYGITERAHDTVVNFGAYGTGIVYRNFSEVPTALTLIPTRVFGIGIQRTGTSSLHAMFRRFGMDAGHWKSPEWAHQIWRDIHQWGASRLLEQDYALSDNPIPMLYEKLDKFYPGSRFILTVRDEDEWLESCENFWSYDRNPERWTWDSDGFSHRMHGITYGTHEFDETTFRRTYRQHNESVRRHFAGRCDFLQIDVTRDSTEALRRFLNKPPQDGEKYPHLNRAGTSHGPNAPH